MPSPIESNPRQVQTQVLHLQELLVITQATQEELANRLSPVTRPFEANSFEEINKDPEMVPLAQTLHCLVLGFRKVIRVNQNLIESIEL